MKRLWGGLFLLAAAAAAWALRRDVAGTFLRGVPEGGAGRAPAPKARFAGDPAPLRLDPAAAPSAKARAVLAWFLAGGGTPEEHRDALAALLAAFDDREAGAGLLASLYDEVPFPAKRLVLEALYGLSPEKAADLAAARYSDERDLLLRRLHLEVLSWRGDPRALPFAAKALDGEQDAGLRQAAAAAFVGAALVGGTPLSELWRAYAADLGPGRFQDLLDQGLVLGIRDEWMTPAAFRAYAEERDPAVREAWIRGIVDAGLARGMGRPFLEQAALDASGGEAGRIAAIHGLLRGEGASPETVERLLADPSAEVAAYAIRLLPRDGEGAWEERLTDIYRARPDEAVRRRILGAFGEGDCRPMPLSPRRRALLESLYAIEVVPGLKKDLLLLLAPDEPAEAAAYLDRILSTETDPAVREEAIARRAALLPAEEWAASFRAAAPRVRERMLASLAGRERLDPALHGEILASLRDAALRAAAAGAARGSGDPALLAAFGRFALDPREGIEARAEAVRAIGAMSDASGAGGWLRKAVETSREEALQLAATRSLERFPSEANGRLAERILLAREISAPDAVRAAAAGLLQYGDGSRAAATLSAVLKAEANSEVRHAALKHLRIGAGKAAEDAYLREAGRGSDPRTQLLAVQELYRIAAPRKREAEAVLRRILSGNIPPETRKAAERTLSLLQARVR